jgi:hypothetical protein
MFMKNNNGIKKIAVKAGTTDAEIYKTIVESEPGSKKALIEPGLSAYLMNDGTTLEIYGLGSFYPDYLFAYGNTVVSFRTNNLNKTVGLMEQKGAVLLGNIETVCTSYKYCHMLTLQKTVIGLYEQG